jgi:uncharacterized protein with GYD domain
LSFALLDGTVEIEVFVPLNTRGEKILVRKQHTKEANIMALYMVQFAYTAEALGTMGKNPQDRSVPSRELIEKLGGRLIGFYFCFGEYDGVAIYEAPDDTTASAISMVAASPGHLKASHTTRLFTAEETMEAMRKASSITFQGPAR